MNLTPREREVIKLVPEGLSQREMAQRLFISLHTIKRHLNSIYRKLGVSTVQLLTIKVIREDL